MAFKFLAVAAAAVLSATVAQATDLPNKKAPPAGPLVKAAAYDWTGVYVGGSIGGAQTADDASSLSGEKLRRGVPGVYAGWNYRIADRFVVGVEADANYMGFEDDRNSFVPGGEDNSLFFWCANPQGRNSQYLVGKPGDVSCSDIRRGWITGLGTPDSLPGTLPDQSFSTSFTIRDLDTLRLRAGYLMSDNILLFATAGLGIAHADLTTNDNGIVTTASGYHSGWVAGGGLEYGYSKTVSMKLDYLYYDLGEIDDTVSVVDLKGHLIRAGIATRF